MLQTIKNYTKFPLFTKCGGMEFKRAKITDCKPGSNYRVCIRFDDRVEGKVDLSDLVGKGIFEAWKRKEQVKSDPLMG